MRRDAIQIADDHVRPLAETAAIGVRGGIAGDDARCRGEQLPCRSVLLREIPRRENYRTIFHSLNGSTGSPMMFS